MRRIKSLISKAFNEINVCADARPIGLFRLFFFGFSYIAIFKLFNQIEFLQGSFLDLAYSSNTVRLILFCWLVANTFLTIGLFTKPAAIINLAAVFFVNDLLRQSGNASFFNELRIVVAWMAVFAPVNASFSLDSLIFKKQPTVTLLDYALMLLCSVGILYTASALSKLFSSAWLNGTGIMLSLATTSHISQQQEWQWLLQKSWLSIICNYAILVWELLVIPLFFFKKLRVAVALIGITFHLSIAWLFYLPHTSLHMLSFYVLCLPFIVGNYNNSGHSNCKTSNKFLIFCAIVFFIQLFASSIFVAYQIKKIITRTHSIDIQKNISYFKPGTRKFKTDFKTISSHVFGINGRKMFTDNTLLYAKKETGFSVHNESDSVWIEWTMPDGTYHPSFEWNRIVYCYPFNGRNLYISKLIQSIDYQLKYQGFSLKQFETINIYRINKNYATYNKDYNLSYKPLRIEKIAQINTRDHSYTSADSTIIFER